MQCFCLVAVLGMLGTQTSSLPSVDWGFQFTKGQVLHYRIEHETEVAETNGGKKVLTKAKLDLIKRWEVLDVDAEGEGVTTLRQSITAMRSEQTRPNGEVLLFDSRSPDKSTPELREQMAKFIGQPLALLRVNKLGRVVEVKQGVASRYEAEPPFGLILPPSQVASGQSWQRDYVITLDPPHGSGDKHPAQQQYQCTKNDGQLATISLKTTLLKMPAGKAEQVPLVQKMHQGEIIFDLKRGRLHSTRLVIDLEIQGHQGEGSIYGFRSTYQETYLDNPS